MAQTTPVKVVTWLDPPLQTDFEFGAWVTWHFGFVDRITMAYVTPDVVTINITQPPETTSKTTVSTPNAAIVNDATGVYHYDLQLNAVGIWIINATAVRSSDSAVVGSDTMKLQVFPNDQ